MHICDNCSKNRYCDRYSQSLATCKEVKLPKRITTGDYKATIKRAGNCILIDFRRWSKTTKERVF
jgi:hypothetical protein